MDDSQRKLEGTSFWQAIDRFQASACWDANPSMPDMIDLIAEIYIASHGIERRRKKPDYGYGPQKSRPRTWRSRTLRATFTTQELTQFAEGVEVRWPDIVSTKDRDDAERSWWISLRRTSRG